jgi:hypothetical protein
MKTCAVKELFNVQYGNGLELAYLHKDPKGFNFVARGRKDNGISSRVRRVIGVTPFPEGCITVAVSGSVMESFLQKSPFYTAFHVMVLSPLPNIEMTDAIKLYYCMCLRRNKFRYSYGRQANETLKDLQIPTLDAIPEYVKGFSMRSFKNDMIASVNVSMLNDRSHHTSDIDNVVPLRKLFRVVNGVAASNLKRSSMRISDNWIPYLRPSYRQSTSIDAYVNKYLVPQDKIFPQETLYVSTNGQGSHTYSYVSTSEFVPNSDVAVLIPKQSMTLREKLFYSMCISRNRFKFSYGRKPKGEKLESILLPESISDAMNSIDLIEYLNGL